MSEENTYKRKKINWTTDKIMSTSALFISVVSLIALLYQSYLAREENKLIQKQQSASVLPYLNSWQSNTPNSLKMIFGNKGVGPAFIKKVDITFNDTIKFNNTDKLFQHIFKHADSISNKSFSTSTFTKGLVLTANETIEIIHISNEFVKRKFREYLNSNKLNYSIIYEDVYGSKWELKSSNGFAIPKALSK